MNKVSNDSALAVLVATDVQVINGQPGAFCYLPCGDIVAKLPNGLVCRLNITNHLQAPFWDWDGRKATPTVSPSILTTGVCEKTGRAIEWHGYLNAGVFESC